MAHLPKLSSKASTRGSLMTSATTGSILRQQFSKNIMVNSSQPSLILCLSSSPRFKTLWIADSQKRSAVWELVRRELLEIKEAETESASVTSTTESGAAQ